MFSCLIYFDWDHGRGKRADPLASDLICISRFHLVRRTSYFQINFRANFSCVISPAVALVLSSRRHFFRGLFFFSPSVSGPKIGHEGNRLDSQTMAPTMAGRPDCSSSSSSQQVFFVYGPSLQAAEVIWGRRRRRRLLPA
jgi:hypothetical protein